MPAIFAAAAFGQQTVYLKYTVSPQALQDLTNAVRAVAQIENVSVDAEKKALVITGTAEQLGLAQWLAAELDRSSAAPAFTKKLYSGPASDGKLIAIFSLAHATTPQALQEAVNVVRSVADIQRFIPYNPAMAIAAAGTADQIAAAEWLLGELDAPMQPRAAIAMHDHTVDVPARAGTQAQVILLPHPHSPLELQQMINTTRSIADVQRLFPMNSANALTLRATPEQVQFADWLLIELDKPAEKIADSLWLEHAAPGDSRSGNLAAIFYFAHAQVAQPLIDSIRAATKLQRLYPNTAHNAVAMRGTGDQLTLAKQMLQENDR